jgi:hypothetical protein
MNACPLSILAVAERLTSVQTDSRHDDGKAIMKYHAEMKCDTLLPHEKLSRVGQFNEQPATIDFPPSGDGLLPKSNDQRTGIDYSEEAIPERDPAYRLPDGTLHQTRTVEHVPAAVRRDLVRRLKELGMSAVRAAMVASL